MKNYPHPSAAVPARRSIGIRTIPAAALTVVLSCAPATVLADLYTWTDERGTTVLSNVMPANPKRLKDFEVVVKEEAKPATPKSAAEPYDRATTERLLLDRIASLEREMKAQQAQEKSFAAQPEPQYVSVPTGYTGDMFYPSIYSSYALPGSIWGYPQTTIVGGSSYGAPYRGFGNFRSYPYPSSYPSGRPVAYPVSVPVSIPVSRPVPYPAPFYVRR